MKNELRVLKAQRTKLLNKECKTIEQFEDVQDKLNKIELQMKMIKESN